MSGKEENKGEQEVKIDSLMWSEEDYDAMQKITGFDEESIAEDQRKGINLIVFIVVCITFLIVGILIGYNINKKSPEGQQNVVVYDNPDEKEAKTIAIYNRLNASLELYLYVLNSEFGETSILDLTNQKYAYQYIDKDLYVLLEKNGLNLYDYSFSENGYHRELITKFEDKYDTFYFKNELILIKNQNAIKFYNIDGTLNKEFELDADQIYDYNSNYVIYAKDNKLYVYYVRLNNSKNLTKNVGTFLYFDSNRLFYIEQNKLYDYSIVGNNLKEVLDIESNTIFTKINKHYMFNDGNKLYFYDDDVIKLKEFDVKIDEIANLDYDNIIFILEDYSTTTCMTSDKKFYIYNISSQSITEKNINGCLNTQVINEVINTN